MRQGITDEQSRLLTSWLGSYTVVRDCSWPLQDTNVLDGPCPWAAAGRLADAFQAGLGKTVGPAEADLWRLENLNQAIGTVVWAHQMGDTAFEQAGRDMVERVLATR